MSFNWVVGYVGSNSMTSGWAWAPALEARSFKHWTTRGKSPVFILFSGKMRESDCLTQILKKIEVRSIISGIEDTKLPSLSSSKWIHLLWTTGVCIQSSFLYMLPYTDKEPGWKSGGHDPTCACHHIQVNHSGGAQFQHF